jgi:hypothetical protein
MKDEELKIEEIETSHTLGGYIVKKTNGPVSRRICYRKFKGLVVKKTHGPVWM